jgi:hypothetical protein
MRIQWRRILLAGLWSELLLLAIYLPARRYAGTAFTAIAVVDVIGLMFLAGLWTARKLESLFLLHGALVGLFANIIYAVLRETLAAFYQSISHIETWSRFLSIAGIKIIACMAGAYVGKKMHEKNRPTQDIQFPI